MDIRTAGKGVVSSGGGIYNIGFGDGDETQFSAYNMKELDELWRGFCEENGIKKTSVNYVERV